jgi:hypothetical protein
MKKYFYYYETVKLTKRVSKFSPNFLIELASRANPINHVMPVNGWVGSKLARIRYGYEGLW